MSDQNRPSARVLLDSISPGGQRLTTLEVTMHRFVLAEFNTHRAFSRNSASSRAIPVEKRLHAYEHSPAWPISLPAEQPGMQGGAELTGEARDDAQLLLSNIHEEVALLVEHYLDLHQEKPERLHKSVLNRYLEPFLWHTVIVTSTEWQNFLDQRDSWMAQPEIAAVAKLMRLALEASKPAPVQYGDWHMPLLQPDEVGHYATYVLQRVSVARCARVSYLTHEGKRDIQEDLGLYERLLLADPPHWSPFEHVARPARPGERVIGNLQGWHQLRHVIGYEGLA